MNQKQVTARIPLRISFAGGGTDVDPYPKLHSGAVTCSTIKTYVHADVWETHEDFVEVRSIDTGSTFTISNKNESINPNLLLSECIKSVRSAHLSNFSVAIRSTVPPGSGLGASSAISLAILGALKFFSGESVEKFSLAADAYDVERNKLGIAGGYQDQYACSLGGFNLLEFNQDGSCTQKRININLDFVAELEHDLILFWTGATRLSDGIIRDQTSNLNSGNRIDVLHRQKKFAYQMAEALEYSQLNEIGGLLNSGWQLKRQYSKMISNPSIDKYYKAAMNAGALGGKLLGAGGGGFLLLLAKRQRRHLVVEALRELGLVEYPIVFDEDGAKIWSSS